jgi:hypothetical protein
MKINDGNVVQGLYNANTAPLNCIYTPGDIVVNGTTLFTCKGETSSKPTLELTRVKPNPVWELYMGDKWEILNSLQEIGNPSADKVSYIGPKGLSEYIKSLFGGLKSNGMLTVLSDPSNVECALSGLTKNSMFQLDYTYLTHAQVEPIPFVPNTTSFYVVRTTGEMKNEVGLSMLVQEIIEYPQSGAYKSWVRYGADLSTQPWTPTRGSSFDSEYIQALDHIVAQYVASKEAYDSILNNINSGNYYSFITVPIITTRTKLTFRQGVDSVTPDDVILDTSYHYKVFMRKLVSPNIYKSLTIDITPEDFIYNSAAGARLNYAGDEAYLFKSGTDWLLSLPRPGNVGYEIVKVIKAKNIIS